MELPPGRWVKIWLALRDAENAWRFAIAFFAAITLGCIIKAWDPPFAMRLGYTPTHNVTSRSDFSVENPTETKLVRDRVVPIYVNDPARLRKMLTELQAELSQMASLREVSTKDLDLYAAFGFDTKGDQPLTTKESLKQLEQFRDILAQPAAALEFNQAIKQVLEPYIDHGILAESPKKTTDNSTEEYADRVPNSIRVYTKEQNETLVKVSVTEVLLGDGSAVQRRLRDVLTELPRPVPATVETTPVAEDASTSDGTSEDVTSGATDSETTGNATSDEEPTPTDPGNAGATKPTGTSDTSNGGEATPADSDSRETPQVEQANPGTSPFVADHVFHWLWPRLRNLSTLTFDETRTTQARLAVPPVLDLFYRGDELAEADKAINESTLKLLLAEYDAYTETRSTGARAARFIAVVAMIVTMLVLCGLYMVYRDYGPLGNLPRTVIVLCLAIMTVAIGQMLSVEARRGEILPLMLFGMMMTVVYHHELALLLAGAVALTFAVAIGHSLDEFILLMGATTIAIMNTNRIRSRTKLIYVGLFAGVVAAALSMLLGLVENQPFDGTLLREGLTCGFWALAAGFVMTGLLPFVEKLFGVLTDLSLLELGDVAHPLLQELVSRAPSTYNHSIAVGTIAEAAAEAIGARGLLCRVGAYFHDIGKMMGPGYFIENQGPTDENRHETLAPAMSSLVIVAHVKDGADLARQHHLPPPIIDLIEQHHGTTQVGFFYEKARQEKLKEDPDDAREVDQRTYSYPGPKPQSKEAGILMLADNVESASRTLIEPTPKRIETLVHDLLQRRLEGGQFDESGLTLKELRTVERSLVKSLTSIYHGRIKYPEKTEK